MLQTGLEILALPHFLEKGEPHVAVVEGDVARSKKQTGSACAMRGPQAGRQEPQCASGALEIWNRCPAFPHHINEHGMERIGRLDSVAKRQPFFLSLLPFGIALGIGSAHLREFLTVGFGGARCRVLIHGTRQQAPLYHVQNLVVFDGFPTLILAGGEMLHGLEQAGVLQGLPFAGLQRVNQYGVGHVAHRHREALEERQGFVAQRRLLHAQAAGADQVLQEFVQQDEAGPDLQQFNDLIPAGSNALFILLPNQLITLAPAKRPCNPTPNGLRLETLLWHLLAHGDIEKLAVHHGDLGAFRSRQPFGFGQGVQCASRQGAVQQGRQGVGFAAAERRDEFEHTPAFPSA